MKVQKMDEFALAFELANEAEMVTAFTNEINGSSKKDEDTLKGFVTKLVTKECNKFPFATLDDVDSVILPECINQIKIMKNSTKTKDTFKNDPDRIKALIRNAAYRRVSIVKVCLKNYILPEFASAVLMAFFTESMISVIYSAINESGIAQTGASKEQLEDAIQTIVSRINEGFESFNTKLDTIIQNHGKYSN